MGNFQLESSDIEFLKKLIQNKPVLLGIASFILLLIITNPSKESYVSHAKFEERENIERLMHYEKESISKNQKNDSLNLSTLIQEVDMSNWINKQSSCQSLIILSLCQTRWTEEGRSGGNLVSVSYSTTYSINSIGLLGKTFIMTRNLP